MYLKLKKYVRRTVLPVFSAVILASAVLLSGCGSGNSGENAADKGSASSEVSSSQKKKQTEKLQSESDEIFAGTPVYGKKDQEKIDDYIKKHSAPEGVTLQNFYESVKNRGLEKGAAAIREVQKDYGEMRLYVSYNGKSFYGYKSIEIYDDSSQNETKTGKYKYLYTYSDLINAAGNHDFIPSGESFFLTDMKPVKAYNYITDFEKENDGAEPEDGKVLYLTGYDA